MNIGALPTPSSVSGVAPNTQSTGARRVFHCGNVLLSTTVFFCTLALALVALHPSTSHYLLSERHRSPALNESDANVIAGFSFVVVEAKQRTVLVVPAPITSVGVHRVSRKLDFFFSTPLRVEDGTASVHPTTTSITPHTHDVRLPAVVTLSDIVAMLLQLSQEPHNPLTHPTQSSTTAAARHRNVLHLCSALACSSPFVVQQWSNRGTAAAAMRALRPLNATIDGEGRRFVPRWRRVHNFALVYGEAQKSTALMQVLSNHHVFVAQTSSSTSKHDGAGVMPLVGDLQGMHVVASCSSISSWCRYSTMERQERIAAALEAEATRLTTPAAKARLFAEWNAVGRGCAAKGCSPYKVVRQIPLSSVVFGSSYTFQNVPFDLVYVDVSGEETVAVVAFLHSITTVSKASLPPNILLSLYESEYLDDVVHVLAVLESVGLYTALPLVSRVRAVRLARGDGGGMTGSGAAGDASFAKWWWRQSRWLHGRDDGIPFFSQSASLQTPLLVVLLSRQFSSPTQLQHALEKVVVARSGGGAHGAGVERGLPSAVDRFFFDSLQVTLRDEDELNSYFNDAEDAVVGSSGFADAAQAVLWFLLQYIYLLIPLGVAGVLLRSLCRPHRSR
jgi:hypothetical protein